MPKDEHPELLSEQLDSSNPPESLREKASVLKETSVEDVLDNILNSSPSPKKALMKEYCRLYIDNIGLLQQINAIKQQNLELNRRLRLQQRQSFEEGESGTDQKKRRSRRSATEIARHFTCPHPECLKSYGSEASLIQHRKLKHGYSTSSNNNQGTPSDST